MEETNYPTKLSIVLGDMDYFALEDNLNTVTTKDSIENFKTRMNQLQVELQQKADYFFDGLPVEVSLWSQKYSAEDFNSRFLSMQEKYDSTITPELKKLFAERLNDHYRRWGYGKYLEQFDMSKEELDKIIMSDLIRMSTHYSLESEITNEEEKIQLWTEKSSNMNFLLNIAHFQRNTITPSMFI